MFLFFNFRGGEKGGYMFVVCSLLVESGSKGTVQRDGFA